MKKKTPTKLTHQDWLDTVGKSFLKKNPELESELHHVRDFLRANPKFKVSTRLSFNAIKDQANKWMKRLNEKNKNLKESGRVETAYEFEEGLRLVRLANQVAKDWEGKHMGHCVASYKGHPGIYSLRDDAQIPHCTFEITNGSAVQIKGKANGVVALKYHPVVLKALEILECELTPTDLKNIGYHEVDKSLFDCLESHYSGLLSTTCKGRKFINYSSKLKLIKPITMFNAQLYELMISQSLDCPEAFSALLKLKFGPGQSEKLLYQVATAMLTQNRLGMLKAAVNCIKDKNNFFLSSFNFIERAVNTKNLDMVKYLGSQQKHYVEKWEQENSSKLMELAIFDGALVKALYLAEPKIALELLKMGAKVEFPDKDVAASSIIEHRQVELFPAFKPLFSLVSEETFSTLMFRSIELKFQEGIDYLLQSRNYTMEMKDSLVNLWYQSKNEKVLQCLIDNYLNTSQKVTEFMRDVISNNVVNYANLLTMLDSKGISVIEPQYLVAAIKQQNSALIEFYMEKDLWSKVTDWSLVTDANFKNLVVPMINRDNENILKLFKETAETLQFKQTLDELYRVQTVRKEKNRVAQFVREDDNDEEYVCDADGRYYRRRYYGRDNVREALYDLERQIVRLEREIRAGYGGEAARHQRDLLAREYQHISGRIPGRYRGGYDQD